MPFHFNISARVYDFKPVKMAREIFPSLTVEIPTISEAETRLKQRLVEMNHIGVEYLNLHQ
ncbi:MAG: hypothetical protein ACK2TV_07595 [Anaerolineales bacterium]